MTKRLTKTAAASLELVEQLAAHLDAQSLTGSVSKAKVIRWTLKPSKDARRRFTDKQRRMIVKRDKGICFYCGNVAGDDWEADHVLPHSLGGQTVIENGVCACRSCNNSKSDKVW